MWYMEMTAWIAILISFLSLCIAFYFSHKKDKKEDTTEVQERATREATINLKLDCINNSVNDIKEEVAGVRKEITGHSERLAAVEQSAKSAHHRIDELSERVDKIV